MEHVGYDGRVADHHPGDGLRRVLARVQSLGSMRCVQESPRGGGFFDDFSEVTDDMVATAR